MIVCMKKRQLKRRILFAGMFMIQPGIMAPDVTEYNKINQAIRLPDIYSKTLFSSCFDPNLNFETFTIFSSQIEKIMLHPYYIQSLQPFFYLHYLLISFFLILY